MTFNAIAVRADPGEVMLGTQVQGEAAAAQVGPPMMGTTTSLACYLQNGSDVTWQWGLNNDNSWFVLNGQWITTPYSGLTKFVTNTSLDALMAAAANAIRYYQRTGYTVESILAADGSTGYNYPIVSGGVQLFPRY